ncbi:MAG: sulfotransferase [Deltaproteobacteria bacterium]|nr:sulfotransferase [Deltaproteobacteria bacterium]
MQPYVLIHSLGRSGSNVLLDSLDLPSTTHCRNEPHSYGNSPLSKTVLEADCEDIESCMARWDEAVYWMSTRWGGKDRNHPGARPKIYFRKLWRDTGVPQFLIRKSRVRKLLSFIYPEFCNQEYRLPPWLLIPGWNEKTVHVFKLLNSLEFHLPWILEHCPEVKVVYLVRHPLGYAKSLYQRLYQKGDKKYYHERNLLILKKRLPFLTGDYHGRLADEIKTLSLFETVVWNWLTFNDETYRFFRDDPRVLTVVYEQLLCNPLETIKSVYNHCGLSWNILYEAEIYHTFSGSAHLAVNFHKFWPADKQETAKGILRDSAVMHLWDKKLWSQLDRISRDQKGGFLKYSPY